MQNISLFSLTMGNMVVQMIAVLKNSELGKHFESYSLNIASKDIADKNYFKDGEPFILPYYVVVDEIF